MMGKTNGSLTSSCLQKTHVNILEIIGNASFGGMEKYIINFITHLPSDEFKITFICPYESAFTTSLHELGHKVYITPITDDPTWRSVQLAAEVTRLHEIDVLHAHMPKAHVLAGLAGCLTHKPVVATVHGMDVTSFEFGITRQVGSHLITNCQESYGQALGLGVPAERVSLIQNGVDIQLFTPGERNNDLRHWVDIPDDTPLIGFAGRLAYEKGPDLFLRAAQEIHCSRPDVHFVVIGYGAMQEELIKMRSKLSLEKHVHFIGWQTNMQDIYRSLDLLVHSSRSDGTSLVLLEAMACGCPVVALDVGGVREVVENDDTGILAPAGDWEGIAVRVLELIVSKKRLKTMGITARLCIEKKFDLRTKTQHTADLLRQIALKNVNGHKASGNGIMVSGNGNNILYDNSAGEN